MRSSTASMDAISPILAGLLGSLVAGLCTGVGALPIFLRRQWSALSQRLMLAAAGGMMLGATFFSLLLPALEIVRERGGTSAAAAGVVGTGVMLGAFVLWLLHAAVPHEHFGSKGREGARTVSFGRNTLFVLAIALHNVPEGLSVGIAYASGDTEAGHSVMLGIALQNAPEGLAVAAALIADGTSRGRAFAIALLTGLVEPVSGVAGAFAVSLSAALLPWGLAFAAGAMLFVVSGEVLPETHTGGTERPATFAVVAGFVVMLVVTVLFEG